MSLASLLSTTMTVKKDLSIVADSTCPSSPTFRAAGVEWKGGGIPKGEVSEGSLETVD